MITLSSGAQTPPPVGIMNFSTWAPFHNYTPSGDSIISNQKWYVSHFSNISAGAFFYSGGSTTYLSAPVGIQLNRPLNNNLIAFAGIYAAPTFYRFSSTFTNPLMNPSYPGNYLTNPYTLGINTGIEMGLMYINDARTFSISGSIGIDRSSYPVYPSYPAGRTNTKKH